MRLNIQAFFLCLVAGCGGSSVASSPIPDSGPSPVVDSGLSLDAAPTDAGTTCNVDQDCVGGTCVYDYACPGTCLPYRTLGESCGSSIYGGPGGCTLNGVPTPCAPPPIGECVPDSGMYCVPDEGKCGLVPGVVFADAGAHCSIFGPVCNSGFFCAGVFPDNGTCESVIEDGGTCTPATYQGCADGLACVGSDLDAGSCRPLSPLGGDCLSASRNPGCAGNLVCVSGTCEIGPASGPCVNGACAFDASYCDSTTNTCVPRWPNGTPCSPPDSYPLQCQSMWCDLTGHCGTTTCPAAPLDAG